MRLRSSQFVFLMLLVCSLRIGEEYAAQLTATVAGSVTSAAWTRECLAAHAEPGISLNLRAARDPRKQLSSAARSAHRAAWTMPPPASASAAIISHTGLLRG